MSENMKLALVLDSRIENITDTPSFAVHSGPQNNTYQSYPALSQSSSLLSWQIQVPNESIVTDAHVWFQSQLTFTINISTKNNPDGVTAPGPIQAGDNVFQFGNTEAWAPFPLNQSLQTIQSSINNCSVSVNIGDIFPQLLRMTSSGHLQKYNSGTTAMPDDRWGNYADAAGNYQTTADLNVISALSNPLGGLNASTFNEGYFGRGCFPTNVTIAQTLADGVTASANPTSSVADNNGNKFTITVSALFTEPIMLSPFLNCQPTVQPGFLGLNTLTVNMNVSTNAINRCLRTAQIIKYVGGGAAKLNQLDYKYPWTVSLGSPGASSTAYTGAKLLLNYLTLDPSQVARISLRNIRSYTDYPRYITTSQSSDVVASGVNGSLTSANIQLNQLPSRFIINVRPDPASLKNFNTDSWFTIRSVSINLNNKSGLLSTAVPHDLWVLSQKAGCGQSYMEFLGESTACVSSINGAAIGARTANTITYDTRKVPSIGSLLVINTQDLSIDSALAPGSLGQFNFQITINYTNTLPYACAPQCCIVVCNEGLMSTIAGSTTITTGLLNSQMVLSVKEQEPAADSEALRRFVGGVMSNAPLADAARLIEKHYRKLPMGLAQGITGMGMSGGASSGGASSGGRRHLSRHFV